MVQFDVEQFNIKTILTVCTYFKNINNQFFYVDYFRNHKYIKIDYKSYITYKNIDRANNIYYTLSSFSTVYR